MKIFEDSLNTAVFTTKFVFKDRRPITFVSHDIEDGAWQFFSDDDFEDFEKVAMVVSLDEIIEYDRTVLEIADLPLGHTASRPSLFDKWVVQKQK
jgi:hypothetical protein